ncbi:MAG TPA: hypothetical protein VLJ86_16615 [Ramlibacter sp.]|nr:hypothetical protein [Ramlibacter sp.]
MQLQYLDFDYSEDAEGNGSFDAMAAAAPAQLPLLEAEVLRVLAWADKAFGGGQGPLDAGGEWDFALQGSREVTTPLDVQWNAQAGRLDMHEAGAEASRVTLSLTLSGTPAFCAAFRDEFTID